MLASICLGRERQVSIMLEAQRIGPLPLVITASLFVSLVGSLNGCTAPVIGSGQATNSSNQISMQGNTGFSNRDNTYVLPLIPDNGNEIADIRDYNKCLETADLNMQLKQVASIIRKCNENYRQSNKASN
jgi:hypothetical protein